MKNDEGVGHSKLYLSKLDLLDLKCMNGVVVPHRIQTKINNLLKEYEINDRPIIFTDYPIETILWFQKIFLIKKPKKECPMFSKVLYTNSPKIPSTSQMKEKIKTELERDTALSLLEKIMKSNVKDMMLPKMYEDVVNQLNSIESQFDLCFVDSLIKIPNRDCFEIDLLKFSNLFL